MISILVTRQHFLFFFFFFFYHIKHTGLNLKSSTQILQFAKFLVAVVPFLSCDSKKKKIRKLLQNNLGSNCLTLKDPISISKCLNLLEGHRGEALPEL